LFAFHLFFFDGFEFIEDVVRSTVEVFPVLCIVIPEFKLENATVRNGLEADHDIADDDSSKSADRLPFQ
jgi:hypothetical protein